MIDPILLNTKLAGTLYLDGEVFHTYGGFLTEQINGVFKYSFIGNNTGSLLVMMTNDRAKFVSRKSVIGAAKLVIDGVELTPVIVKGTVTQHKDKVIDGDGKVWEDVVFAIQIPHMDDYLILQLVK